MPVESRSIAVIVAALLILPGALAVGVVAQDTGNNSSGPNTQWENATAIDVGTEINETTEGGDENWYQFDVGKGGNITVNATTQTETKLVAFLYEGGTAVDRGYVTSGDATVLQAPANASESYFFYVRNERNNSTNYTFTVEAPEPETETSAPTSEATTTTTETPTATETAVESSPTQSASTEQSSVQRGLGSGNASDEDNTTSGELVGTTDTATPENSSSGGLVQTVLGPAIGAIVLIGGSVVLFLVVLRQ